ncbi:MAG: MGMT family protein [Betaproteobacteria bacterium]|nr:MGMT family protein [Betaproteobacteria bacterium]
MTRRTVNSRSSRQPSSSAAGARCPADTQAQRAAAILAVVRSIPRGRVTTYGAVAARAGLPRQARLVGKVLGGLGGKSDVPWQRVVAAGGRIAFPAGSDARASQVSLLADDGVDAAKGRVDLARYGWGAAAGDLDQLLWSGE